MGLQSISQETAYKQAVSLFNQHQFFKAHESWEALWMRENEPAAKDYLQGLIQISAALYKWKNQGNMEGVPWLLSRGLARLKNVNNQYAGFDLASFAKILESHQKSLLASRAGDAKVLASLAIPKIKLV